MPIHHSRGSGGYARHAYGMCAFPDVLYDALCRFFLSCRFKDDISLGVTPFRAAPLPPALVPVTDVTDAWCTYAGIDCNLLDYTRALVGAIGQSDVAGNI